MHSTFSDFSEALNTLPNIHSIILGHNLSPTDVSNLLAKFQIIYINGDIPLEVLGALPCRPHTLFRSGRYSRAIKGVA